MYDDDDLLRCDECEEYLDASDDPKPAPSGAHVCRLCRARHVQGWARERVPKGPWLRWVAITLAKGRVVWPTHDETVLELVTRGAQLVLGGDCPSERAEWAGTPARPSDPDRAIEFIDRYAALCLDFGMHVRWGFGAAYVGRIADERAFAYWVNCEAAVAGSPEGRACLTPPREPSKGKR